MISTHQIRMKLKTSEWVKSPFEVMSELAIASHKNKDEGRELIIRALDKREQLPEIYKSILDELAASVGLYPYLDSRLEKLSNKSALLHAACTIGMGEMNETVLHSAQFKILQHLLNDESIVLSAPTSFGKSLLIDLVISQKKYNNIVLIVPTLALIEETRRRMAKFSGRYTIITSSEQQQSNQNIYVLTQERYITMKDNIKDVDFFAIDEFYKLSSKNDESRASQLNQSLLHLVNTEAQFFMLGPSIRQIPSMVENKLNCKFFVERFQTVVTELTELKEKPCPQSGKLSKIPSLVNLLCNTTDSTLIYCKSPQSARKLLAEYIQVSNRPVTTNHELLQAADWTSKNYHPEWLVTNALKHGIGIHHGRLPRSLARFMVRAFEEKKLKVLICTSTLIEGVNTSAKNVILYDDRIGNHKLDFFTFNNIRGRSGRMFKHFIGNVYYYSSPPKEELPFVDMPAVNPTDKTSDSILIHIEEEKIPPTLRDKYNTFLTNELIPFEELKKMSFIEPQLILNAAMFIRNLTETQLRAYIWTGNPDFDQLQLTSELIWKKMGGNNPAKLASILSAKQMTYLIHKLYQSQNLKKFRKEMINSHITNSNIRYAKSPDDAVEEVLRFLRNWASYHYPKYLISLSNIINFELERRAMPNADYTSFAVKIENLCQPRFFSTLEEYGLPMEFSENLVKKGIFSKNDSFENAILALRNSNLSAHASNLFEKGIIDDFLIGIGSKLR